MPGREHLGQRLDVVGHAGHQPPDRRAVEERRRQRQHVAVDAHAQVVHAALADHLREVELRERRARTGRPAPAGRARPSRSRPASRPTRDVLVDRLLEQVRLRDLQHRDRPAAAPPRPAAARGTARRSAKIRRSSVRSSAPCRARSRRTAIVRSRSRGPLSASARAARGRATRRGRPAPAARRACPRSATRPPSSTRIWSASFTAATRCEIRIDVRPARIGRRRVRIVALGLGVDRRQRVVEDQDLRVGGQRARQRHPLPLAARQRDAALADQRVVAVGQHGEVGRQAGRLGRAPRRARRARRRRRAPRMPKAMFSATVAENRNASCGA